MLKKSANNSSTGRVMVIGLDGATWDLARPWILDGTLPNLARLVAGGASAGMRAELPPSSVPNWPAFMTGKNAAKHGCVWWLQNDDSGRPDSLPINARSIAGDTIWSYLSAMGKKVIVQNVPVTYPVEPVNGVMISGLLTPRQANDFVYPPELKPELDAAVGGYQIYPETNFAHGREQVYVNSQLENIRQHAQAAEYLLKTREWDFFILVLGPTDESAHKLWHYMDTSHPLHKPEEAALYGDSLKKIYQAADEAVGLLSQQLTENDTLIVMSDHGFGPVESFFHINNWLIRKGYLRLKRTGLPLLKQILFRVGFTPRNVYPLGKQLLALIPGTNTMRQRLDPGRQGRKSPLRHIFLTAEDIDWSRTRAYATGFLCGQLFINKKGREAGGIVTDAEYEALRSQIQDELSRVKNPSTNKPHYQQVFRREDQYHGPFLDRMPDLLCVPADFRTADSGMGFRSGRLFDTDSALTGTHREIGIFTICGPGIRQNAEMENVRIQDIAPTILYRLGLPIPDDMDGQVAASAFEQDELARSQVQFVPGRPSRFEGGEVLSAEEDETIKERLRDLGYLA